VDRTQRRRRGPDGRRLEPRPERCWFSDGGITSNLPVHFFDEPLPGRPTFAINLRPLPRGERRADREEANVWMPRTNRGGIEGTWDRFAEEGSATRRLTGFLYAVLSTMQGWNDNTQTRVPGYRDRVVHVFHDEDEGGLNIDMGEEEIARLAARGGAAGRLLRRRFAEGGDGSGLDWDNHRWVRLRSTLALVEKAVHDLASALSGDERRTGAVSFARLIGRGRDEPPTSYRLRSAEQRRHAEQVVSDLLALSGRWAASGASLQNGAPRPAPELRIRPRM
jgi:hypothetical protein